MNIADKTVLITGASRGIGRALVDEALRRGARLVYAGTRGPLQLAHERARALTLDVTVPAQIERAVGEVASLDVLVNNAGIGSFDDLSSAQALERHMAVNLFGLFHVTRAFLPQLVRSRGAIVNNLSLAALAAVPAMPAYSVSKAAAFNLTQALRALLRGRGVAVHAAVLGPIDTEMSRGIEVPKATAQSAAQHIFDGLERGEDEIFPDPASQSIAEGWRGGPIKQLEREFRAFVPATTGSAR